MNASYNKEIAIATLESYIKQIESMNDVQRNSYSKVYKSLKDTLSLMKTFNDMNVEEANEYYRILMASVSASLIIM